LLSKFLIIFKLRPFSISEVEAELLGVRNRHVVIQEVFVPILAIILVSFAVLLVVVLVVLL